MDKSHNLENETLWDWKKGFIVLLDVLGVKGLGDKKENTEDFLERYELILKGFPDLPMQINKMNWIKSFEIALLNDALVFCVEPIINKNINTEDSENDHVKIFIFNLFTIGIFLRHMFYYSLRIGIPIRGVISYGDYVHGDRNINKEKVNSIMILGPAVYDAGDYYEKYEWLGIRATPLLSEEIDKKLKINNGYHGFDDVFCKYNIPIEEDNSPKLWSINWPMEYLNKKMEINKSGYPSTVEIVSEFKSDIEKISRPKEAENKYINTLDFIESITPENLQCRVIN